jgi:OFA family oxalate/formate antiporter-like MFS transporter
MVFSFAQWFPDKKGLVTGIILGGFGLGSFIFTQVQTAILNPNNVSVDKETG